MTSPDFRRAAMLDQAAVANQAAAEFVESFTLVPRYRVQAKPGPHVARCMDLMLDLGRTGQLTFCTHMLKGGVLPGSWLHWAPTGVLCGECALLAARVHAGGARCARCRMVVPYEQYVVNAHMKPAEFDDRREPFVVVPPLLFWVGLCRACQVVEDSVEG